MSSTSSSRLSVLVLAVMGVGRGLRLGLVMGDEHLAVRPVPGRDLVAPPELARNAPGLDVLHPVEIGLLPGRRDDRRAPLAHRGDGGLGQRLGVDVPLVGQIGLDRRAAAVAVRDHVHVVLDLVDQPLGLHHLDDALAGGEAVEAIEVLESTKFGVRHPVLHVLICTLRDPSQRVDDLIRAA